MNICLDLKHHLALVKNPDQESFERRLKCGLLSERDNFEISKATLLINNLELRLDTSILI